jgi:hypothetical protein
VSSSIRPEKGTSVEKLSIFSIGGSDVLSDGTDGFGAHRSRANKEHARTALLRNTASTLRLIVIARTTAHAPRVPATHIRNNMIREAAKLTTPRSDKNSLKPQRMKPEIPVPRIVNMMGRT